MPDSAALRQMKRELRRLRQRLLPKRFDQLGNYPPRTQTLTRAYVVLSHAEIEHYLEFWAKDLARKAESLWSNSKKIGAPLLFLLAKHKTRLSLPSLEGTRDSYQILSGMVTTAFVDHYKSVKENNGIKQHNLHAILYPVGVPAASFGAVLIGELDSFGERRGVHAHGSAAAVSSVLDPQAEHDRVERLVAELGKLDTELRKYRNTIR